MEDVAWAENPNHSAILWPAPPTALLRALTTLFTAVASTNLVFVKA